MAHTATTASHEARSRDTLAILDEMSDGAAIAPSAADAELAVARLREMSTDLRGAAILDSEGRPLAASGNPERWADAGRALLAAADAAAGEAAAHAHVGTEDGEAFAVRQDGVAMVAVAERFTLASLMVCDMRAVLRDLVRANGSNGAGRGSA
jgi:predicted regulator of Ras-like GTPase activity (Roadblock/LC7/MglB family)